MTAEEGEAGRTVSAKAPIGRDTWLDLALLLGLWLLCVAGADPRGEFPINDDWSFAMAAKSVAEQGSFLPLGWTGMPLLTQALWGALFCLPGGFSFEALRTSTLVLALLGISATHLLIRQTSRSRLAAGVGAACIAFNPIYFSLSNSFMTDVPFTAMTTLSAYFFSRCLQRHDRRDYALALLLSLIATLDRQVGVAVPLAYGFCILTTRLWRARTGLRAALPPVLCLASLVMFEAWMRMTQRLPALYHKQNHALLDMLTSPGVVKQFGHHTFTGIVYLGLFLFPLLILQPGWLAGSGAGERRGGGIGARIPFLACLGLTSLALLRTGSIMPLSGNILTSDGIGPLVLSGATIDGSGPLRWLWLLWTLLGLVGGSALIVLLLRACARLPAILARQRDDGPMAGSEPLGRFCLLCAALYLAPIFIHGFYDRYLLPSLPFLAAWISASPLAAAPGRTATTVRLPAITVLLSFLLYGVLGTRDLFAWNRARRQVLNRLTRVQGVSPHRIDGGFEFNGLHLYDSAYRNRAGKNWWWVDDDAYIVAMAPRAGYDVIGRQPYERSLSPRPGAILLLRRRDGGGAAIPPPSATMAPDAPVRHGSEP